LPRLEGMDGSQFPVAEEVSLEPVALFEVRQIVNQGQTQTVAMIQNRIAPLRSEILEILRTPRANTVLI
jgi:hypothetical protein